MDPNDFTPIEGEYVAPLLGVDFVQPWVILTEDDSCPT